MDTDGKRTSSTAGGVTCDDNDRDDESDGDRENGDVSHDEEDNTNDSDNERHYLDSSSRASEMAVETTIMLEDILQEFHNVGNL